MPVWVPGATRRPGSRARSTRSCTSSSRPTSAPTSCSASARSPTSSRSRSGRSRTSRRSATCSSPRASAFFLFATLLRAPAESSARSTRRTDRALPGAGRDAAPARHAHAPVDDDGIAIRPGTGLTPVAGRGARARAAADDGRERHGPRVARAGPAATRRDRVPHDRAGAPGAARRGDDPRTDDGARRVIAIPVPAARPSWLERARQHPYVRLALNGSFSALWVGPGHQPVRRPGEPDRAGRLRLRDHGLAARRRPDLLRGHGPQPASSRPIAGAFVDRWDQKQVLVVSDILRAALVLLVPVAVLINVWLAYPLVFLITTVSIFFRPARQAILPRIVPEEDLLSANSAMWVGETLADVINYPIAGLFVVFLQSSLPLAFWFDAVTYLASAALLATIVVPPLVRRASTEDDGRVPTRRRPRSGDGGDRGPPERGRRPQGRLGVPAPRDGPAGEHPAGDGRPVLAGRPHGVEPHPRQGDHAGTGRRLPRHVRLHGDGDRHRQPGRRVHAGRHRQPCPARAS